MTAEELLEQKRQAEIEKARRNQQLLENEANRNKTVLAEDKAKSEKKLADTKLTEQGNIRYQGDKSQMQGSILDQYSGFGKDTGAGIQRQNIRELGTQSRLANLEKTYGESLGNLESDYNRRVSDIDFGLSQGKLQTENEMQDINAKFQNDLAEYRFNKAEEERQRKIAEEQSRQQQQAQSKHKYENDISGSILSQISKGNYSQDQINTIISNAQKKYGLSDEAVYNLRVKTEKNEDILPKAPTKYRTEENFQTKANLKNFDKELSRLNSDRIVNTFGWMTRLKRTFTNPGKTGDADYEQRNNSFYKDIDNPANFARDTYNIADAIIKRAENGDITVASAQDLLDKYRVINDIDKMQDSGYIDSRQASAILTRLINIGLNPTL